MKKPWLLSTLIVMTIALVPLMSGCKKKTPSAEKMSAHELFNTKCTQCHGGEQATKLHGTEQSFLDLIKRMNKKGAQVSSVEARYIAGFLSDPSRYVFETSCSHCHELDRVLDAHKAGTLNEETMSRMKKKGAKITSEDVDNIIKFLDESLDRMD